MSVNGDGIVMRVCTHSRIRYRYGLEGSITYSVGRNYFIRLVLCAGRKVTGSVLRSVTRHGRRAPEIGTERTLLGCVSLARIWVWTCLDWLGTQIYDDTPSGPQQPAKSRRTGRKRFPPSNHQSQGLCLSTPPLLQNSGPSFFYTSLRPLACRQQRQTDAKFPFHWPSFRYLLRPSRPFNSKVLIQSSAIAAATPPLPPPFFFHPLSAISRRDNSRQAINFVWKHHWGVPRVSDQRRQRNQGRVP